ncbi:MAG: PAS domain S-box protein, partial [Tepidiformaceae bacterium]
MSRGHSVAEVGSLEAALTELSLHPGQLVVLVALPGDVQAAACQALASRMHAGLVVVVPQDESPFGALAAINAGADDVLPCSPDDPLFDVRLAALERRVCASPDPGVDLAALLDSASDVIYLLDLNGHFIYVNAAAEAMSGYTRHQIRGRSIGEFVAPELRAEQEGRLVSRSAGNTAPSSYTSQVVTKDGRRVTLEVHARPVLKDGTPVAVQGIARDITARVREQEQHALLAAIIDSSDSAVISYDLEGRITSWNPGATRLYGWSADEMLGQTADAMVPPGQEASHADLNLAAYEARPATVETVRRDRWGRLRDVRIAVFPVFDPAGIQLGTGTSTRDISAEKQAQEALSQSEERRQAAELARRQSELNYQAVFEGSAEALYVMERDAAGKFRCVAVNEAYVQLMDRPRDFVLGKTLAETSADEASAARLMERFAAAAETGRPVQWEWTQLIRGVEVSAIVMLTPMADGLGGMRLIGSIRDITERQRAEKASREARETLQAVLANAPVLLNAFDADGRVTVSEGAALVRVRRQEELRGRTIIELYPGRDDIAGAVTRALSGEPAEIEYELHDRRFVGRARPLVGPDGNISGAIAVSFDVTERAAAERALRTSEAYVRSLVDSAPVILIATDAAGVIELSTGAGLSKLGRAPGQAVGQSAFELFAGYPEIIASLGSALSGETVLLESEMGGYAWETRYTPVVGPTGAVTSVIVVSSDVTARRRLDVERQQAAAALRESEARLRALFDSAVDGFVLLDSDVRVVSINPAFQAQIRNIFGLELAAGELYDLRLPPDRAERFRQRMERAQRGEHVFNRSDFIDLQGNPVTTELTYYPVVQDDGSISGVALVSRDITARRLAEDSLRTEKAFSGATVDSLPGIFYL